MSSEASTSHRRRYNAPKRAARAAETKRRIVAAAHDLFVLKGYAPTTIDEIAASAGVSRPTVFVSTGGKPELLKLVRDMAIGGDDEPVPLPRRAMFIEVWEEPDARRALELYARNMRIVHARVAAVEEVLQSAAQTDPELQALAQEALSQRRYGCGLIAESVASKAPLREGLTVRAAGDVVYAIASPHSFRLLTVVCGWAERRYQTWLAETLIRELLPPTPGGSR